MNPYKSELIYTEVHAVYITKDSLALYITNSLPVVALLLMDCRIGCADSARTSLGLPSSFCCSRKNECNHACQFNRRFEGGSHQKLSVAYNARAT